MRASLGDSRLITCGGTWTADPPLDTRTDDARNQFGEVVAAGFDAAATSVAFAVDPDLAQAGAEMEGGYSVACLVISSVDCLV